MEIRRIVPNIPSGDPELCREFYVDFLGLRQAMNLGWIATYVSPNNPTTQISIVKSKDATVVTSSVSVTVEVSDVNELHREAVARGYRIAYPLTDEPWGVRRFAVADPNGVVLNIMRHLEASEE